MDRRSANRREQAGKRGFCEPGQCLHELVVGRDATKVRDRVLLSCEQVKRESGSASCFSQMHP